MNPPAISLPLSTVVISAIAFIEFSKIYKTIDGKAYSEGKEFDEIQVNPKFCEEIQQTSFPLQTSNCLFHERNGEIIVTKETLGTQIVELQQKLNPFFKKVNSHSIWAVFNKEKNTLSLYRQQFPVVTVISTLILPISVAIETQTIFMSIFFLAGIIFMLSIKLGTNILSRMKFKQDIKQDIEEYLHNLD